MARSYLLGCTALCSSLALIEPSAGVAKDPIVGLLNRPAAPSGVVFEIVGNDATDLQWALSMIGEYVRRLRTRFPDMELAVVTHGVGQFAQQNRHRDRYAATHRRFECLVERNAVPVNVCETQTAWNGVTAEDFLAYVNVAPSGPAQIRRYKELGYEFVRLEKPSG